MEKNAFNFMLRSKHRALVQQILNLNQPLTESDHQASLRWKVLIYDQRGLSILTTLLKVSNLLEVGVTFYGSITQKREPIPDVSAVYFLEPTPENLRLIAQDCAAPLYDQMHINFLYPILSEDLENFASLVNQCSDGQCIHSIIDQYIEFSSIDPNLFTLFGNRYSNQPDPITYPVDRNRDDTMNAIYGFRTTDDAMDNMCKIIGEGLASVFITSGEIPKVLYQSENRPSNSVFNSFKELISQFSGNFEVWGSRRSETSSERNPPLLLILDRTIDFASPLHHPSSYEALVHDHFGIRDSSVEVGGESFDLDCDIDSIWSENRTKNFDAVLEAIGREAAQFRAEYGAIEGDIAGALKNLPELSHKRIALSTHTRISEALVKSVKDRHADAMFKMEEDILLRPGSVDLNTLVDLINSVPDPKDKLRVAAFAYMCNAFDGGQIDKLKADANINDDLSFLKRYDNFRINPRKDNKFTSIIKNVALFGSQSDSNAFAERLPVVETVKRIRSGKIDGFKLESPINSPLNLNEQFDNIYVFIIGPGNYVEYNGLMELGKQKNIDITYGCTSMMRPCEFIEFLQK